jgi:membrane-associated protease RseP (regulator of RpoE activity)
MSGPTPEMEELVHNSRNVLSDLFEIGAIYVSKNEAFLSGKPFDSNSNWKGEIIQRLQNYGYFVSFQENGDRVLLQISLAQRMAKKVPWTNIALFLLTLITTFSAGAIFLKGENIFQNPMGIFKGASFAIPLMSILLCHEFGHYFFSLKNKIKVTLPYFIPGPTYLGTFGAFIKSKSPFKSRRDLLEVGTAGPISGFVATLIVMVIGLSQSKVAIIPHQFGTNLGDSLILTLLTKIVIGEIPPGHDLLLSPMAFAGWVGFLVTMFNLLPMGQLDGGHIMYALLGKKQKYVAWFFVLALIPMGFFLWLGWFFWLVLILLLRVKHPPTLNDEEPLDLKRKIIGWISVAIFILTFTPIPIK